MCSSYLHTTSNLDKCSHTQCFGLYIHQSLSSCLAISYYANLRPTHTPWRRQLVKGQAVYCVDSIISQKSDKESDSQTPQAVWTR